MRSARSTRASSRRQAVAHVEDGSEKDDTKYGATRRGANKDGDDASSPISIHDGARSDQEPILNDTKRKPARSQTSSPMSSQNGDASDQELLSPPKSSSRKAKRSRVVTLSTSEGDPSRQDSKAEKETVRRSKRARRPPQLPGQESRSPYLTWNKGPSVANSELAVEEENQENVTQHQLIISIDHEFSQVKDHGETDAQDNFGDNSPETAKGIIKTGETGTATCVDNAGALMGNPSANKLNIEEEGIMAEAVCNDRRKEHLEHDEVDFNDEPDDSAVLRIPQHEIAESKIVRTEEVKCVDVDYEKSLNDVKLLHSPGEQLSAKSDSSTEVTMAAAVDPLCVVSSTMISKSTEKTEIKGGRESRDSKLIREAKAVVAGSATHLLAVASSCQRGFMGSGMDDTANSESQASRQKIVEPRVSSEGDADTHQQLSNLNVNKISDAKQTLVAVDTSVQGVESNVATFIENHVLVMNTEADATRQVSVSADNSCGRARRRKTGLDEYTQHSDYAEDTGGSAIGNAFVETLPLLCSIDTSSATDIKKIHLMETESPPDSDVAFNNMDANDADVAKAECPVPLESYSETVPSTENEGQDSVKSHGSLETQRICIIEIDAPVCGWISSKTTTNSLEIKTPIPDTTLGNSDMVELGTGRIENSEFLVTSADLKIKGVNFASIPENNPVNGEGNEHYVCSVGPFVIERTDCLPTDSSSSGKRDEKTEDFSVKTGIRHNVLFVEQESILTESQESALQPKSESLPSFDEGSAIQEKSEIVDALSADCESRRDSVTGISQSEDNTSPIAYNDESEVKESFCHDIVKETTGRGVSQSSLLDCTPPEKGNQEHVLKESKSLGEMNLNDETEFSKGCKEAFSTSTSVDLSAIVVETADAIAMQCTPCPEFVLILPLKNADNSIEESKLIHASLPIRDQNAQSQAFGGEVSEVPKFVSPTPLAISNPSPSSNYLESSKHLESIALYCDPKASDVMSVAELTTTRNEPQPVLRRVISEYLHQPDNAISIGEGCVKNDPNGSTHCLVTDEDASRLSQGKGGDNVVAENENSAKFTKVNTEFGLLIRNTQQDSVDVEQLGMESKVPAHDNVDNAEVKCENKISSVHDKGNAAVLEVTHIDKVILPVTNDSMLALSEEAITMDLIEGTAESHLEVDTILPCSVLPDDVPKLNISKLKIQMYTAAVRGHRGKGVEKLFARYWSNLYCCINHKQMRGSRVWHEVRQEINAFLTTKKLRRLHNAFLLGIMQLASHTNTLGSVVQKMPFRWRGRLGRKQRMGGKEILEEGVTAQWKSTFAGHAGVWCPSIVSDPIGALENGQAIDFPPNRNPSFIEISSCLPGALIVDPLVRSMVEDSGLKVSENAIWLMIVATREYITSLLKGTISNRQVFSRRRLLVSPIREDVEQFNMGMSKRNNDEVLAPKLQPEKRLDKLDCITALDIASFLSTRPSYSTVGGIESHLAYERCLQSSFGPRQTSSLDEFNLVCQQISVGIERTARNKRKVTGVYQTSDTKDLIFLPPIAEAKKSKVETTSRSATPFSPQPRVSQSNSQRSSPGMGRGAKDLAALKARVVTVNSASNAPSAAVDDRHASAQGPPVPVQLLNSGSADVSTQVGSVPIDRPVFGTHGQQFLPQHLVLPTQMAPAPGQPQVMPMRPKPSLPDLAILVKGPMHAAPKQEPAVANRPVEVGDRVNNATFADEESESANSKAAGISSRVGRGRGFGVKNLAAIRAKSSTVCDDSTIPPSSGVGLEIFDEIRPTRDNMGKDIGKLQLLVANKLMPDIRSTKPRELTERANNEISPVAEAAHK